MKKHTRALLLASLCGATLAPPLQASGSYSNRSPKPRAETPGGMKLDHEKYGLGQKIYDGRVKLMAAGDVAAQTERLKTIQAQLPGDVAAKKDLVGLAGKLSSEQLDALDYFVKHRFGMKK